VGLSSLSLVFSRRAGFPVFQTWFVSRARPLGGVVTDASTAGSCSLQDTVVTLSSPAGDPLATTSPDASGAYDLGEWATQAGYTVRLTAPAGCAIVGAADVTLDNRGNDGDPASQAGFAVRRIVPQPISGTVTDTAGDPVPGVIVTLTRPDSITVSRTTGPDGTYLFDDNTVGPGYALALAVPSGFVPGPGGTSISGLEVAAAPITGHDFVVSALPAVGGRVTGGGRGLGGVPVALTPVGGGPVLTTVTTGDGRYLVPALPPGDVTVSIGLPPGYGGSASRTATVGADVVVEQDFALTRPGAASGLVTAADAGVTGAALTLDGPGGPRTVTTDPAGGCLLEGLAPGAYTVTLAPPAGYDVTGSAQRSFVITAAGEIRGGLDFTLVAAVVVPPTSTTAPTPTATPTAAPTAMPTTAPTPTATPTATPTSVTPTSATPTGVSEPTRSASPTVTATNDPPTVGRVLPDTGGHTVLLPGLAGLLIAAGAVLIVSSRRRPRPGDDGPSRRG